MNRFPEVVLDHPSRRSSWCLIYQRRMILQMQCACQSHVALRMGADDRLIFRMMSEVFSVEVLFQVAAAMLRPQALHCRQFLVAKAENALSGFAFEREGSERVGVVFSFSSSGSDAERSRRRKPRPSCKLQRAVTASMACTRRLHSSSGDEVGGTSA